jgi:hypothetical protein
MKLGSWWIVVLTVLAWGVLIVALALVSACEVSARLEYQAGPARAASAASAGE